MASADQQLPEGTDTVITGAGVDDRDDDGADGLEAQGKGSPDRASRPAGGGAGDQGENGGAFFGRIEGLRGQATDRARDLAQAGKDRATSALDNLVQTVEDAASEIDEKLGAQYGDYARRAAQGIGSFSESIRDKDIDDLFNDARELVRKSPAIAVGTAAALGFVVARLARSAVPERASDDAEKA
jgi:ElaB/YqjD/DUF883 family membrane-anchored ribosome-binding protein